MEHNRIIGSVPTAPSLEELRLENNRLTGSIPWNVSDHLKVLSVRNNLLNGSFPVSLGSQLSMLEILNVGENAMVGSLEGCATLARLKHLYLEINSESCPFLLRPGSS